MFDGAVFRKLNMEATGCVYSESSIRASGGFKEPYIKETILHTLYCWLYHLATTIHVFLFPSIDQHVTHVLQNLFSSCRSYIYFVYGFHLWSLLSEGTQCAL